MATTIALPQELKEELQEFGVKGETFADIIERLLESAKQRQLQELLMDTSNSITIAEARRRLKHG